MIALASKGVTTALIVFVFILIAHSVLQTPVQAWAYGKTLKLHPLVALLVTVIGLVFGGIAGAIIAQTDREGRTAIMSWESQRYFIPDGQKKYESLRRSIAGWPGAARRG